MDTQTQIPDEMLHSGDVVDVEYEILGTNDFVVNWATADIERALENDGRFDLERYWEEDRVDLSDGSNHHYVTWSLRVRQVPRNQGPELYTAGIHVVPAALIALVASAVISWSAAVIYRGYITHRTNAETIAEVEKIRTDPSLSDEAKAKAYEAIGKSAEARQQKSIGTGIAAFGGSLVTAAIIIGVLWALSLSRPLRPTDV